MGGRASEFRLLQGWLRSRIPVVAFCKTFPVLHDTQRGFLTEFKAKVRRPSLLGHKEYSGKDATWGKLGRWQNIHNLHKQSSHSATADQVC